MSSIHTSLLQSEDVQEQRAYRVKSGPNSESLLLFLHGPSVTYNFTYVAERQRSLPVTFQYYMPKTYFSSINKLQCQQQVTGFLFLRLS